MVPGANLNVVWLLDHASPVAPIFLQLQDQVLEGPGLSAFDFALTFNDSTLSRFKNFSGN